MARRIVVKRSVYCAHVRLSSLEQDVIEGENPVCGGACGALRGTFEESGCLGMQPKRGGKFHLRLNIGTRPIANKYREGKMKSTLKRQLKARETVKRETIEVSSGCEAISY